MFLARDVNVLLTVPSGVVEGRTQWKFSAVKVTRNVQSLAPVFC